jgi:hypothetical protein
MGLRVQTGTSLEGDPILTTLSWGGVADNAAADDIDAVAQALEELLEFPVVEIQRSAVDTVM